MRGQTKIAVAIGAVVIVAGAAYYGSRDKQPPADASASNQPVDNAKPSDSSTPTIALSRDLETSRNGSTPGAGANSSDVASPSPRRIDDGPGTSSGNGSAVRPEPAETSSPSGSYRAAELPGERAGLSTVVPSTDATAAAASDPTLADVPPNADKDARPSEPALPPITPVGITSSGSPATRPSSTPPVIRDSAPTPAPLVNFTPGSTSAKPADKPTEKPAPRTHVIKKGDTYTSLAVEYLGSAKHAKLIEKANPGKSATKLFVGAKVNIPDLPASDTTKTAPGAASAAKSTAGDGLKATAAKPAGNAAAPTARSTYVVPPADPSRSYTVQPGEGWFDLAAKFLGKGENYPKLYEYNKERVGGDPHLLRAGTVIELPPEAKLPAPTTAEPKAPPAK